MPNGGGDYRRIKRCGEDASYKAYFTYQNYDHRIQSMYNHELDRAAVEGLPEGYEDARGRD